MLGAGPSLGIAMTLFRAAGAALFAAITLTLAACGGATQNPESVAKAFMSAYAKKDAAGMLALMSEESGSNRQTVADAVKEGPTGEAYQNIFDEEMMKIVARAKVEGPRYQPNGRPVFKVAEDDGSAMVMVLDQKDGKWAIVNLDDMPPPEFMALPDKKPAA
jgi:hypothetical protein